MDNSISREMAIKELARRELERRRSAPQQQEAAPAPSYDRGAFAAASEAASDVFGFGDELTAGAFALGESAVDALQGKGFNFRDNYNRIYGNLDQMTAQREQAHPVASMAGNVVGDIAAGGTLAKGGLTIAGKGTLPAMAEGAGYGAATGAGYSRQDEKTGGAITGAVTGAVTAGAMDKLGNAIANRAGQRAAQSNQVPARNSSQLSDEASALYDQMRQTGARLPAAAARKAKGNINLTLKETNKELAPQAFALKKQVDAVLDGKDVDIVKWHNLSKQVNRIARGNLQGDDRHYVGLIKSQIDSLRDGNIIGNPQARDMWKGANELVARAKKTEILENALDLAELKTGQYTQAELAHTIAGKFRQIYSNKALRKQFSLEEQKIIRDIGQAKTHSAVVNQLRKLAPRGIVSAALGAGVLGQLFPGGMFIVPAIGEMAQRAANKSATKAAQQFVGDVSRGGPTAIPHMPNPLVPFIPGASAISGERQTRLF